MRDSQISNKLRELEGAAKDIRRELAFLKAEIETIRQQNVAPIAHENDAKEENRPASGSLLVERTPANFGDTRNKTEQSQPWWLMRVWLWPKWKGIIQTSGIVGGVVIAWATYWQWRDLRQNFEVDQRAWIEYTKKPDVPGGVTRTVNITSGQPIYYPFSFKNTGKTPAKNLEMTVFVDVFPALQAPDLNNVDEPSKDPIHADITLGVLPANEDTVQVIWRGDSATHAPVLATDAEMKMVASGTGYFVVFGIIKYQDIFGVHHWTKFCDWNGHNGNFATFACTQYNDQDANR
jgi:hypothetical protein